MLSDETSAALLCASKIDRAEIAFGRPLDLAVERDRAAGVDRVPHPTTPSEAGR